MNSNKEAYKRTGNLVYIKKPSFEELEYTKKLWSDYESMKDVGGTFDLNERKRITFYKKMINPTDGKNFYCIVYRNDGTPVGEVSFHGYDSANKIARLNIRIQDSYRGKGYGLEATKLLLEYYFYEFYGEFIIDNNVKTKEGEHTLKKLGFNKIGPSSYKLTRDEFIKNSFVRKREVAIVAFDGFSLSKLGFITECLNSCNKEKKNLINIDILSKDMIVKSNSGLNINIESTISVRKKYNIVIFIDGIDIIKESEETKKILRDMIDKSEFVVTMDDSISILMELSFLKGMEIILPDELIKRYRTELWNYNLLNKSFIDNGKFILSQGIKGTLDVSIYVMEKLCGGKVVDIVEV